MPGESRPTTGHRNLSHGVDVIIEAWAPSIAACIAEAVAALVDTFVNTSEARETVDYPFRLAVDTPEAALVTVLEEVLYILDMSGQAPVATTISSVEAGLVSGSFTLADVMDRELTGGVPKGISPSGLVLLEDGVQWTCQFIVDV
ncbi:MAG TPA: archease [Jatrophihabitans sp.]|jgi:SHS2 domain-containing protein|nr:archease [Jatrophihabitans sp.]